MVLALRLVDNKAILYFDVPSTTEALTWFRGMFTSRHCPIIYYILTIYFNSYQPEHGTKSLNRLLVPLFHFCHFNTLTLAFHETYGSGHPLLTFGHNPSNLLLYLHPLQGNQSQCLERPAAVPSLKLYSMCLLFLLPPLSLYCLYISQPHPTLCS